MTEHLEWKELCFGWTTSKSIAHGLGEKRQIHRGNTVVDVCYMPPEPEKVDEAFYRQLEGPGSGGNL